jgi:hypothetical protein
LAAVSSAGAVAILVNLLVGVGNDALAIGANTCVMLHIISTTTTELSDAFHRVSPFVLVA